MASQENCSVATVGDNKPLPIFDLPAELVQSILYFAHDTGPIHLHPRSKGKLASSSALMRDSKCMQEYLASLCRHATVIEAHVHSFDF